MQNYSVKLVINQQRIKANGLCSLYLRVIINRSVIPIPIDLQWPAAFFDKEKSKILPRSKNDPDHNDYEMIILNEMAKVNEIFKLFRIQDRILTPELFITERKNFNNRKDLIAFMKSSIESRYKDHEIVYRTYQNHYSTINKLEKFKATIPFYIVDSKFLQKFTNWLMSKFGNDKLTVWSRLKDIRFYLKLAAATGIGINPDYVNFKFKYGSARPVFLEDKEIKSLVKLYREDRIEATLQKTLRAFLFSCFTSLRVSDVQRSNWGWVNIKNEMIFLPWKTRKFGKSVTVPLSETAKTFIERPKGSFFALPTDQEMNRSLKDIAHLAGIDTYLTFHVARHTFATHYYRQTKDILTLSKILGHSKIATTMIYAHINDEDKLTGMQKFEKGMNAYL